MGTLKKKAVMEDEPNLSPGEMVSREAARVEQEILVGLLETGVRNHLYDPFQLDTKIWYEPASMSYHVRLRVAGKDENGKTYGLVFTGHIPEEAIILHASDVVSWRNYMDITVRAWLTEMSRQLNEKGATRLLVGGRRKNYVELAAATESLSRKLEKFEEATKNMSRAWQAPAEKLYSMGTDKPWRPGHQPLSPAEGEELLESLKRSAERRTS